MYIWCAADVDAQVSPLRQAAEDSSRESDVFNPALTLPLHVSLRISFPVENPQSDAVINWLERYFSTLSSFSLLLFSPPFLSSFSLIPKGVELHGSIVWLAVKKTDFLERLHLHLVAGLEKDFGILPQRFDPVFLYHCSLYTGNDPTAAKNIFARLQPLPFPETLQVRQLLIGCSESGRAGDYRVIRRIELKE